MRKMFSLKEVIEFTEWIANTKEHGHSKQLHEAFIRHKVKSTSELIQFYFEKEVEKKPVRIDNDQHQFKGYDIYLVPHPKLVGKYEIYKDEEFISRAMTLKDAVVIINNNLKQ